MLKTTAFLRTRVGRRILGLFMLSALVPVAMVGFIAYQRVGSQLEEQSRARVFQASKTHGMAIIERLHFLETELKTAADALRADPLSEAGSPWETLAALRSRFRSLVVETEAGPIVLGGRLGVQLPTGLSPADSTHLASGKALMEEDRATRTLFVAVPMDQGDLARGILWGEVEPAYLWRPDLADPDTHLCVLSGVGHVLFCLTPRYTRAMESAFRGQQQGVGGTFEWLYEKERFLAGYWPMFLSYEYKAAGWTVISSEPRSLALAPMANFRRTFPLILVLTLVAVFLLSNVQIRRSMDPLLRLQEGTKRIAASEFDVPVEVTSRDEFEDLAGSFNAMSRTLGKQFNTLTVINQIDQAVLSSLDAETIIDSVLSRFGEVIPCDAMSITVGPVRDGDPWKYVAVATVERYRITRDIHLTTEELRELEESEDHLILGRHMGLRSYLNDAKEIAGRRTCSIALPLLQMGKLTGIITLDYYDAPTVDREDLLQARRLADQVAVALSNTRLVEDLNQMSWGTLSALARTIDANSPWTAGHSERVTALAVRLGQELALTPSELDMLHRGALLHDIGKIGIPSSILNKPGPLTEEERRIVQDHTTVGARILTPIAAFAPAIPIVRSHHEWYDGAGYPDGLEGEAIPFMARLLAVPDVYDALISNRPYRAGWTHREAIEYIDHCAATQFDPAMAAAFIAIMKDEAQVEALVRRQTGSPGLRIVSSAPASDPVSATRKAVS
jgi:putative nucleotidyltransferase with HDIG domain